MNNIHRWLWLVPLGASLLLIGGRVTAYISPGEFLGITPSQTTPFSSSLSSSSVSDEETLVPILFGPTTEPSSSASPITEETVLIPSLFQPTTLPTSSSVSSSTLIPSLFEEATISPSMQISASSPSTTTTNTMPTTVSTDNGGTTTTTPPVSSSNSKANIVLVAPAYDAYYKKLAASALRPAAPTIVTMETQPTIQTYSAPAASSRPPIAPPVRNEPKAIAQQAVVTTTTLHAGAGALPSSGVEYQIALLLGALASVLVVWVARQREQY